MKNCIAVPHRQQQKVKYLGRTNSLILIKFFNLKFYTRCRRTFLILVLPLLSLLPPPVASSTQKSHELIIGSVGKFSKFLVKSKLVLENIFGGLLVRLLYYLNISHHSRDFLEDNFSNLQIPSRRDEREIIIIRCVNEKIK